MVILAKISFFQPHLSGKIWIDDLVTGLSKSVVHKSNNTLKEYLFEDPGMSEEKMAYQKGKESVLRSGFELLKTNS